MTDRKFCASQILRCASMIGFDRVQEYPAAMGDMVGALAAATFNQAHAEAAITRWKENSRFFPTEMDLRSMAHATMRPEWAPVPVPVCAQCFDGWLVRAEGGAEPCTCPRGQLRGSTWEKK